MRGRYVLAIIGLLLSGHARAQTTTTGELEIRLLVTASCEVSGSATGGIGSALLDFGTTSLLLEAIDGDTGTSGVDAFEVLCNPNVDYTVTFDAGQNATEVADRAMKRTGGSELVGYQIYSDPGRSTVLTTISGTGTGSAEAVRVYGRVPPQAAPEPGEYRDVVTATVSF